MTNTGAFQSLQAGYYIAGNGLYDDRGYYYPFFFDTETGFQSASPVAGYVFAVRDGDIPAVPEPRTFALMLVGMGVLLVVRRRRSN